MSIKLNDTKLLLLSGASRRADRCAVIPIGAKRRSALRAASQLLEAGLLKEVRAKADAPIWRRDEKSGVSYSLKLTINGAKAIAVEAAGSVNGANDAAQNPAAVAVAPNDDQDGQPFAVDKAVVSPEPAYSAPRSGTKIAHVITLLERRDGAALEELIAATGWLPRTTRAALTGLRKRGYAVALDQSDKQRGSVYRVASENASGDGIAPLTAPTALEAPTAPPDVADRKRTRRAA
jgi:hypothetical protein